MMHKSTLESLPNELLLNIFSYLSSFDLCQSFVDVNNSRIRNLVTSIRHSINVDLIRYGQFHEWLSQHQHLGNCFTDLIDCLVLNDSYPSRLLIEYWTKTFTENNRVNVLFSSLRRFVFFNRIHRHRELLPILKPLVLSNNTLQYLHIIFEDCRNNYSTMLSELVAHRISVHTMILEVEQGILYVGHVFRPTTKKGLHTMQQLCWPNTVQLTLSIQYSCELKYLFEENALPAIEYLNITIEDWNSIEEYNEISRSDSNIELSRDSLRQTTTACTHLKYLVIHFITLTDFITLIDSLTLVSLEELTLIDMYDTNLDNLNQFQKVCSSRRLSLKKLHFSLCFPEKIQHIWKTSSFNCNREWPFENMNCYLYDYDDHDQLIREMLFVISNCPLELLIDNKRTFYSYGFPTYVSAFARRTVRPRLFQWTRNKQFRRTHQRIVNCHVKQFYLTDFIKQETNPSIISTCHSHWNLSFNNLRSFIFDTDSILIEKSQRIIMLERILDTSPNLSSLAVSWEDFRHCSRQYFQLQQVRLLLDVSYNDSNNFFDIHRLNQLVPQLYVLETTRGIMKQNEYLIGFILKICEHLPQLIHLIINKNSALKSKITSKRIFMRNLTAATQDKMFHGHKIHLGPFGGSEQISIWL